MRKCEHFTCTDIVHSICTIIRVSAVYASTVQYNIPIAVDTVDRVESVIFTSCNSLSIPVTDKHACAICPSTTTGGCRNNAALVPVT